VIAYQYAQDERIPEAANAALLMVIASLFGWALESGGKADTGARVRVQFRPMLRRKASTASV
jgi:hypothetical protein